MNKQTPWRTLELFLELNTPWLSLIGEKLENNRQEILDYWRVEKVDSVVIIAIQNNQLILPNSSYRPGVKQVTLDFPGGRVNPSLSPKNAALETLRRELGINEFDLVSLNPLNQVGWAINSSFSNQKLYGFVAEISPQIIINSKQIEKIYPTTLEGINNLLKDLKCLQCRAVLQEWLLQYTN
ncbi:NUDIX domain-containing protein [Crocosphaera sp.]|uniref:NUDIX domain-containing protein n=1 Tax=Crocosphaera sp. TaxID=2729996 RepID=UPI00262BB00D|nr:NUDIX domain-containing protein [Crocosphaera sp.]MDJ0582482.1 NUDIX domain-containing protein [Crocosphaera sp.]